VYAIIQTGGKQYKVVEGDTLGVEMLPEEAGEKVKFAEILLVGGSDTPKVGMPFVQGASVDAEVVEHGRGKKIDVFKKKRRKNYQKKIGHRQAYTEVKILKINA